MHADAAAAGAHVTGRILDLLDCGHGQAFCKLGICDILAGMQQDQQPKTFICR
jgi:hypothetical protein